MENDILVATIQRLEQRIAHLERAVFQVGQAEHFAAGQKQIVGDQRRTDAGMGPLLNANSDFL